MWHYLLVVSIIHVSNLSLQRLKVHSWCFPDDKFTVPLLFWQALTHPKIRSQLSVVMRLTSSSWVWTSMVIVGQILGGFQVEFQRCQVWNNVKKCGKGTRFFIFIVFCSKHMDILGMNIWTIDFEGSPVFFCHLATWSNWKSSPNPSASGSDSVFAQV